MTRRVNVREAARLLEISEGAVRQRIARGSLTSERDADGSVYVVLPELSRDDTSESTGEASPPRDDLVEELRRHNEFLREQLQQERDANRENRRLLAAALERIPEIEPPRATPGGHETASEGSARGTGPDAPSEDQETPSERRSWWRRYFGFE